MTAAHVAVGRHLEGIVVVGHWKKNWRLLLSIEFTRCFGKQMKDDHNERKKEKKKKPREECYMLSETLGFC